MARVLVAYATKYGSTREIAEAVGVELADAGHQVDVRPASSVEDIAPYDAVVLGSALYAAHWQRDANRFVRQHLAELQARPVWLFSSGPLDHSADREDIPLTEHVARDVHPIGARGHRTFGGRLLPDTPGLEPQVLATHPTGDFRNWAAIRAWAGEITTALGGAAGHGHVNTQEV